jgi:hypothetical protein
MAWYDDIESAGEFGYEECSALAAEVVLHCLQEALSKGKSRKYVLIREMAIQDLQSPYIAALAVEAGVDPDAWQDFVARIIGKRSSPP